MAVYQVKISSKHKNAKLRWLATDINFKLLHTGCPITHEYTPNMSFQVAGISEGIYLASLP